MRFCVIYYWPSFILEILYLVTRQLKNRGSIPDREKRFISSRKRSGQLWVLPDYYSLCTSATFTAVRRTEREADDSPPSNVEINDRLHFYSASWQAEGQILTLLPQPQTGFLCFTAQTCKGKDKTIPLQTWTGAKGCTRLRLPDFITIGVWRW